MGMSNSMILGKRRSKKKSSMQAHRMGAAFTPAAAAAGAANPDDFPMTFSEPESAKRRAGTFSAAFLIHGGAIAILVFIASLAPIIDVEIIPVSLLRDEPEAPEPAPAPKALAERRSTHYAPAAQAYAPQIVNPRVIADASAAIEAKALDMDAVSTIAAPTQISRSSAVSVDRVSAVRSVATARATRVDVGAVGGPVVRGPVRANSPVGPSVGPRQVAAAAGGTTSGTGKLVIGGGGSSVKEGILSNRDVVGSPGGTRIANVNTAVGEGLTRGGSGGSGTGTSNAVNCFGLPEVQSYLSSVESRTIDRWSLPPGVDPNQRVTLKFRLDVAGSATKVSLVKADDNALGISAIDALRSASPFPPIPDSARCLARVPITATFSNPGAS
jgi:TonB family protein